MKGTIYAAEQEAFRAAIRAFISKEIVPTSTSGSTATRSIAPCSANWATWVIVLLAGMSN
jgi:hypothetical protein